MATATGFNPGMISTWRPFHLRKRPPERKRFPDGEIDRKRNKLQTEKTLRTRIATGTCRKVIGSNSLNYATQNRDGTHEGDPW
jgi:hypothetical protein